MLVCKNLVGFLFGSSFSIGVKDGLRTIQIEFGKYMRDVILYCLLCKIETDRYLSVRKSFPDKFQYLTFLEVRSSRPTRFCSRSLARRDFVTAGSIRA